MEGEYRDPVEAKRLLDGAMKIMVERQNVFGNVRFYVVGDALEPVRALTMKKTVSPGQLDALRELGHEVVVRDVVVG